MQSHDIQYIVSVPYQPQFNGIEFVWAMAKRHYRKALTMKKMEDERYNNDDLVINALRCPSNV